MSGGNPAHDLPLAMPGRARRHAGALAYRAGLAAEDQVAAAYARRGAQSVARRWRGGGGEIDLVLKEGAVYVFVEVKRAPTHDRALERISARQTNRMFSAATVFLESTPQRGLTETRFDIATVDGTGDIRIIENGFA